MTATFQTRHDILIAAPAEAVFDYVTNPRTWPEWIASSHELLCEDRPMGFGDMFRERWATRSGETMLDWLVIACERPGLWIGLTETPFTGPIVAHYTFVPEAGGTRYTRVIRNPARPRPVTDDMLARIEAEAETALRNIKAHVERRAATAA